MENSKNRTTVPRYPMARTARIARITRSDLLLNLVLSALGVALFIGLGYLCISNYLAEIKLKEKQQEKMVAENNDFAALLGYFYLERIRDVQDIHQSSAIESFYKNRALGMSMQYGLKAGMDIIGEYFSKVLQYKNILSADGQKISVYQRIVLLDQDFSILVDCRLGDGCNYLSGKIVLPSMDKNPNTPTFLINKNNNFFEEIIYSNYKFKDVLSGHLLVYMAPCVAPQSFRQLGDYIITYKNHPFYGHCFGNKVLLHDEYISQIQFVAIGGTPFKVGKAITKNDILSTTTFYLIGLGSLLIVILIAAFLVIREKGRSAKAKMELQNQVFRSSKLASIGLLAGGVAHEINNPLTIIQGQMDIFSSDLESGVVDPKQIKECFNIMTDAVDRIAFIVRGLGIYGRVEEDQNVTNTNVNVNYAIETLLNLVGPIYEKLHIKIKINLVSPAPSIKGNN
ncbi:MAG: hypothetical protein HQK53_00510, partial [Oligoflexia bacterium]|nr:hypothetical protein [Oligoflexia bacterium]